MPYKTKQSTQIAMKNCETASEFYYLDKVERRRYQNEKLVPVVLILFEIKCAYNKLLINLDRSVFTVKHQTSTLLYSIRYRSV